MAVFYCSSITSVMLWAVTMLLPTLRQGVHLLQNPAAAARHDSLTERLVKLQKNFEDNKLRYA